MKVYSSHIRGVYKPSEGGWWTLELSNSNKRPWRDQSALPGRIRFEGGAVVCEHPAYPSRVRLGAGPLDTLGVGHFVHVLQGQPMYGTLYAFHRGTEVILQVNPTGSDKQNAHHIGPAFFSLVFDYSEGAANSLRNRSFTASVPLSDDLPSLYAAFAR